MTPMTPTRSPHSDPDPRGHPDPDSATLTLPVVTSPAPTRPSGRGQGVARPPTPTRTRYTGVVRIYVDRDSGRPTKPVTPTPTPDQPEVARQRLGRGRAWLTKGGYLSALTVVVAIVAAIGQKVYAVKENFVGQIVVFGFDATPWFAPFVFDFAVAALLHGGINAARSRQSPWPWWSGAAIVAGLSVYTNSKHDGAQITASASAGLFIIWGLHLYGEYRKIVRNRQVEDVNAEQFLATDVLFDIDKRVAERALIITQTKPLGQAVMFRHAQGETTLTPRAVAIIAAHRYIDIYDDELYALMNPRRAARPAEGTDADAAANSPEAGEDKVRLWQLSRRRRARRLAAMTASDAVDGYLGLPVPNRRGIVPSRVTYAQPEPTPVIGAAAVVQALPPAPPAAAVPPVPGVPASPRRRAIGAGAGGDPTLSGRHSADYVAAVAREVTQVGQVSGAPSGNVKANWVPLHELVGLPVIDPAIMCECHPSNPDKYCGRTLEYHTQRRGRYVQMILNARGPQGWAEGERVGKGEVEQVCQIAPATANEIGWLFDHLRRLEVAQRAAKYAGSGTIEGESTEG